jgi:plastocyanin
MNDRRRAGWLWVAFLLIPALVLSVGLLSACSSSGDSTNGNSDTSAHMSGNDTSEHGMDMGGSGSRVEQSNPEISGAPQIAVTADAFAFTPKTITLKADEGVNIALTSVDVEHDFFVKNIGHVAHAEKGTTTVAGLTIQEAGTYPFWCTVKGHKAGGMTGTITVTS